MIGRTVVVAAVYPQTISRAAYTCIHDSHLVDYIFVIDYYNLTQMKRRHPEINDNFLSTVRCENFENWWW